MRLYRRSKQVDLNDTIAQCDFDADHGRVKLALERLHDLEEEVGADAKISYAEGLLRRDFLGQGQQAYQCFVRALELNPQHRLAACNATHGAPSEVAFRQRAEVAGRLSPSDVLVWQQQTQRLAEGTTYQELLLEGGARDLDEEDYGSGAALLELALQAGVLQEADETRLRRHRAQALRALDLAAERLRAAAVERFPPDERLSLHEAVLEMDRAIALDEYDAELWNLRSAWCVILERYQEAVVAADRAITLRPSRYPKPYHNKAVALWHLNKAQEASASATRAKQEAQAVSSPKDLRLAESILSDIQSGRGDCPEELVLHTAQEILKGTEVRTHQFAELSQGTVQDLCNMFATRLAASQPGTSLEHVSAVAQLLAYFPAEAAVTVLRNLRRSDASVWNRCFEAMGYIVAKGEPVMQRDAARVAALLILDESTLERMRHACRERVLAPAAAAPGEFGPLTLLLSRELNRLNNRFPELLLEQPPPSQDELQAARSGMLDRLSGTPFINDSASFQQPARRGPGCVSLIVAIVVLAAGVLGPWH